MNLIIVGGQTSTGKSTLSRRLATDLGIATCLKDSYTEEEYFPSLRAPLKPWQWIHSEHLAWKKIYEAVELAQAKDYDLLIEGNFAGPQKRRLQKIIRSDTRVIEIFCYARGLTTYRRFVARNKSGERHPGHRDELWYWVPWLEAVCRQLGWDWVKPLRFGSDVLQLDTTDFVAVHYETIRAHIKERL